MTDVTVTQADRDAAAEIAVLVEMRELILSGRADEHAMPFARHRTRAAEEMRERCATEVQAWFPEKTADIYPSGGVVAAIRALPITQEAPE